MEKMQIGIIFGGASVEHEISILSTMQALYGLDYNKYNVTLIYMTKDNKFLVGPDFDKIETFKQRKINGYEVLLYGENGRLYLKKKNKYLPLKYRKPISCVIPIVHGRGVEDGSLAGFLNILKVPYTSCDVLSASIIQDKIATKKILSKDFVPSVKGISFSSNDWKKDVFKVLEKLKKLSFPVIVKSASLGSSIGIFVCNNDEELLTNINQAIKYDDRILVEKKLNHFKEYNQAVLGITGEYITSEIEEIISESSYLTFDDKYKENHSKRVIPAAVSEDLKTLIENQSIKVASLLSAKGVIRIDYLYDLDSQKLYVNEVNSIPGSLSFYLFEGEKIYFQDLLDKLIVYAIRDKYFSDMRISSFPSNILSEKKILKK